MSSSYFQNFPNCRKYKFQSYEAERKKSLFIPFLCKSLKSFFFLNQNKKMGGVCKGKGGGVCRARFGEKKVKVKKLLKYVK